MSSLGRAGRVGVAVERQERRARLESWVVHDWVGDAGGFVGSACWVGGGGGDWRFMLRVRLRLKTRRRGFIAFKGYIFA